MSKAANTHTSSRRQLLAAAPVVLALSGAGVAVTSLAPSSDSELLALCAKFHRLQSDGADEANSVWEKASADAWDAFNEIDDLTPQTEVGHQAKAAVAVRMLAMLGLTQHSCCEPQSSKEQLA